jgi:NADPH:quinone reductase-like Zn-dependent oxidoreductase
MIDILLDCVGPSNANLSLKICGLDSEWILYGLLSGAKVNDFNMAHLVSKRINLKGSTLRLYSQQIMFFKLNHFIIFFQNIHFYTIFKKILNLNITK